MGLDLERWVVNGKPGSCTPSEGRYHGPWADKTGYGIGSPKPQVANVVNEKSLRSNAEYIINCPAPIHGVIDIAR